LFIIFNDSHTLIHLRQVSKAAMGSRNVYFIFLPSENLRGFLEEGSIFYGWAERG
jgi:hypothetical protein